MNIGVDFDDVLYPYHRYLKARLKRRYGIDLTTRKVTTFYYDLLPELTAKGISRDQVWAEVRDAWEETESHAEAPLLDPDAATVIAQLRKRHRITLITARHDDKNGLIKSFLKRHRIVPHEMQVGRHEKSGFDALVDDFPTHVMENAASGGYGLLFNQDENSNWDDTRHPRVLRVHSWHEVRETIDRIAEAR